jgi:hypothetical protein
MGWSTTRQTKSQLKQRDNQHGPGGVRQHARAADRELRVGFRQRKIGVEHAQNLLAWRDARGNRRSSNSADFRWE